MRSEFVLAAEGVVRERESKNPNLPTGDIEVDLTALLILNTAQTPPLPVDGAARTPTADPALCGFRDAATCLAVDNVLALDATGQVTLFNLFNRLRAAGGRLLTDRKSVV